MDSIQKVVILFGPPGAGKGTQAELLSQKYNLTYIETSKILEEHFRNAKAGEYLEADGQKYYLADEKHRWETGLLCSFPFVTALLMQTFEDLHSQGKNLLLAGSPRSVYEAEHEAPLLAKLYGKENVYVLYIELSEEQTIYRNSHRRLCELMRHPILYGEETKNLTVCPLDGSKLVRREGLDDPESIKVRLREYREHTLPVIEYFKNYGISVKQINGDQTVADVFGDIVSLLDSQ